MWNQLWKPIVIAYLLGWYLTGSTYLGIESRWLNRRYLAHRLWDPSPATRWFSEDELALHTGQDTSRPILLAIDGEVFDVSSRPEVYGPIGSYRFFSGIDGARAFATGCFKTDRTHDLRGLSEDELESVRGWQRFFRDHKRYWLVGHVQHAELTGEPPAPCKGQQRP